MEVDDHGDTTESAVSTQHRHQRSKQLIEKYFTLLTRGCGNMHCTNQFCASSASFVKRTAMSPNEAAVEAMRLLKEKVNVDQCTVKASELMITQPTPSTGASCSAAPLAGPSLSPLLPAPHSKVQCLSTELIIETIERCKQLDKWTELLKLIGSSFSQIDVLMASFRLPPPGGEFGTMDRHSLQKACDSLTSIHSDKYELALINAINTLSTDLSIELKFRSGYERDPDIINVLLMVLLLLGIISHTNIDQALPEFLKALTCLPVQGQKTLVERMAKLGKDHLTNLLFSLQTFITIRVSVESEKWGSHKNLLNSDTHVINATKVLKLVYYASLVGGERDPDELVQREKVEYSELKRSVQQFMQGATQTGGAKEKSEQKEDDLASALSIRTLDGRKPLIARHEFINDMINDTLEMDHDFTCYRSQGDKFSFMNYSFMLNTATKSLAMYYDSRVRMITERRLTILSSLINGGYHVPYLRLRVRRDHLIDDALVELEVAYMDNPNDLKKQLYVEFEGEQGIDEGGVSKEFFQLITEEIFNPDFGMFVYDEETRQFWFNPDSFENEAQFTLVGILLGLAIYNNIILDVKFPLVVYRKLMGKLGTLEDMKLSHPVLYTSFRQLLDYEGNVEEDFMTNFSLSRQNMFGEVVSQPLKPGGTDMFVTNDNRKEYCDLYAHCLLNQMIEKQFNAFFKGFQMVTDESPLEILFMPEEVEELVCGSDDWDIEAMEASTEYDSGYDKDSETIKHFWQVVHAMSVGDQKKLLQFISGSDRVPVGGLSKLKLVIARHGPDSDRLPTSHTCFNVLLLPDYRNLDKLKERLMLAITHAQGFGML